VNKGRVPRQYENIGAFLSNCKGESSAYGEGGAIYGVLEGGGALKGKNNTGRLSRGKKGKVTGNQPERAIPIDRLGHT